MKGELTLKKQSKVLEEAKDHAEQLRKAYRHFRKSPDGKIIMADLEKRFYDIDMSKGTEQNALIRIGRQSVVYYIRKMGEEE